MISKHISICRYFLCDTNNKINYRNSFLGMDAGWGHLMVHTDRPTIFILNIHLIHFYPVFHQWESSQTRRESEKNTQESQGIRQWTINWCTSTMIMIDFQVDECTHRGVVFNPLALKNILSVIHHTHFWLNGESKIVSVMSKFLSALRAAPKPKSY